MADAESTGAASVYRFSTDSIRRALDSGRTAGELLGELSRRGTVPQALAYLIEDVARRHAVLRIGSAATFLRCDDPVVLAGILADPGAAALGLFRPLGHGAGLRAAPRARARAPAPAGALPAARAGTGADRRSRPDGLGAVSRRRAASTPQVTPALAAAAVRAIRANDRADPAERGAARSRDTARGNPSPSSAARGASPARDAERGLHPVPTMAQQDVMAVLRSAIATDSPVWIGYADPTGVAGDRRVEPLRLAGGYLTALDLRTEAIQSFALARITGVQPSLARSRFHPSLRPIGGPRLG